MKTVLGSKLRLLLAAPAPLQRMVMYDRYNREVSRTGEKELTILDCLSKPGSTAVDVGANLGAYSFAMSRLGLNVLSFEPNPDLAGLIRRLRLPNVEVFSEALSDTGGEAVLSIPIMRSGHVLASLEKDVLDKTGAPVQALDIRKRTLDDLRLDSVSLLKIDTEGHEEKVLKGSLETLKKCKPSIVIEIEERHNKGGISRIKALLSDIGYRGFFIFEGRLQDIDKFDAAIHQDARELSVTHIARDLRYATNFIFLDNDRDHREIGRVIDARMCQRR